MLHRSALVAVLSRAHLLARKTSLVREEMAAHLFPDASFSPKLRFLSDVETILFLAATGQGIGLVPDYETLLAQFREKVSILPL